MLMGVALVIIFSRLVPAEDFGVFARSFAFVNIVGAILFGWLQISLLRFANGHDEKILPGWRELLAASTLPTIPLIGLALIFSQFEIIDHPYTTAIATAGYSLSISFSQYARGLNNPYLYGLIGAARMIGVLLTAAISVKLMVGGQALIQSLAIGAFASIVIGLLYTKYIGTSIKAEKSSPASIQPHFQLRELLAYGGPASLSLATVMLLIHADRFVASYILSPADLGLYSAQVDLARQMVYPVISAIGVSLLPNALRLEREASRNEAERYIFRESSILIALVAPLIAIAVFYPEEIFTLLLPSQYSTPIGFAGSLAAIAAALTGLRLLRFDPVFHVHLEKHNIFKAAIYGLAAWIMLAPLLANLYSANGLASLGVVAAITSSVTAFVLAKEKIKIHSLISKRAAGALVFCCTISLIDKSLLNFGKISELLHLSIISILMITGVLIIIKIKPIKSYV